jgi:hypothetical protein
VVEVEAVVGTTHPRHPLVLHRACWGPCCRQLAPLRAALRAAALPQSVRCRQDRCPWQLAFLVLQGQQLRKLLGQQVLCHCQGGLLGRRARGRKKLVGDRRRGA